MKVMLHLLVSLILTCSSVSAGWLINPYQYAVSGSCSTPTDGDLLNEGFEGTGTENTWSGSTGSPDFDATWSGTSVTGGCSEAVEFSGTSAVFRVFDLGATYADVWIRFKFTLTAQSFSADYQSMEILWLSDTNNETSGDNADLRLFISRQPGPIYSLLLDSNLASVYTVGALTVGSTYSIAVLGGYRYSGEDTSFASVAEGDTYGALVDTEKFMGDASPRYLYLGMPSAPGASVTYEVDVLQADDDGTF